MATGQIQKLRQMASQKPQLFWSTKNFKTLSPEAILEAVIKYGQWEDFIKVTKLLTMKKTAEVFRKIASKKRSNLSPQTKNYFSLYFHHYAP